MSYCPAGGSREGWISPYTWNYMSGRLDAAAVSAAAADGVLTRLGKEAFQATEASQSLVVNLTIYNPAHESFDPQNPGELSNMHLVDGGIQYLLPGDGYAVQLRNAKGEILYTESFSLTFESEYDEPGTSAHNPIFPEEDTALASASIIIPWSEGTASVVLLVGDTVVDTQEVSAGAPTVEITNPAEAQEWPANSTQTLTWTGDDPDGDSLSYSVLYSFNNGKSWDLVATGLTTPAYEVDVDAFAGSTAGLFRVVATDGINIGFDESAPVVIPNQAPVVTILDPFNGKVIEVGQLLILSGSALDMEDGRLGDDSLHWSSDKQGDLGVGPSLPINTLQPGIHVITLRVQDSQGQEASASVSVVVSADPLPPNPLYLPQISNEPNE